MSGVVALRPENQPPVKVDGSAWAQADEGARELAMARAVFARRIRNYVRLGSTTRSAIIAVLAEIRRGDFEHATQSLGRSPSHPTLERWFSDFQAGGLEALLSGNKGRSRKDYGWELRAQHLFTKPTRPACSTVARWLRDEGFASATNSRVRAYLKKLPSNRAETSNGRLGKHFVAQNVKPHVIRDSSVLPVGHVYEADGHTCDVYVAHPSTGRAFRPELTIWIDVASHYVVGWWLSESESAQTTLFSLSHALRRHDHVPAFAHLDPGPGFKARIIADEVTGFLARVSIEPIFTLPGNARGKGLIEGWFRWFEERLGKRFDTFCGHCRTDDALRRMQTRINRGELHLPSFEEYLAAIGAYVEAYNAQPNLGLGRRAPADLWATLERTPLEHQSLCLLRPIKTATVQRWRVRMDNRIYQAGNELAAYEGREVQVEYDLHDDTRVWVRDMKGRLVAEAALVEKKPWLPQSRIEEGQQRRLEGQRKRLQAHLDEADARSRKPMMLADVVEALDPQAAPEALPGAAERSLERGHSITAIELQPRGPRAQPPVPQAVRDQVAAEIAARELPEESPQRRFQRAIALQADIDRGAGVGADDSEWLSTYITTSEYRGQRLVHDEFSRA